MHSLSLNVHGMNESLEASMSMEHGQNSRKLPLDNNLTGNDGTLSYDDDDGGIRGAGAGGYEY